jgi:hypothetical protein
MGVQQAQGKRGQGGAHIERVIPLNPSLMRNGERVSSSHNGAWMDRVRCV